MNKWKIAFWIMAGLAVLFLVMFVGQTAQLDKAKRCVEASDFCNKKWVESWTNREKILWQQIHALQQSPDYVSAPQDVTDIYAQCGLCGKTVNGQYDKCGLCGGPLYNRHTTKKEMSNMDVEAKAAEREAKTVKEKWGQ